MPSAIDGAGAANQLEQLVDQHRHDEDVDEVAPIRRRPAQSRSRNPYGARRTPRPSSFNVASHDPSLRRVAGAPCAPRLVTADFLRDANDLHHPGNGMDADDVRTREDRGRYGGRCSPSARAPASHQGALHERLARGTDQHGTVQPGGQFRQPSQHTITISRAFGKPDPGRRSAVPSRRPPRRDRQARLNLSATSRTTSS